MPASDIQRSAEFYEKVFGADAPEITARFRDPGGNIIGLYQQRG
jgi:catechol 2,3-dioxygenase-like lactoylglutathione lyase family enzyme